MKKHKNLKIVADKEFSFLDEEETIESEQETKNKLFKKSSSLGSSLLPPKDLIEVSMICLVGGIIALIVWFATWIYGNYISSEPYVALLYSDLDETYTAMQAKVLSIDEINQLAQKEQSKMGSNGGRFENTLSVRMDNQNIEIKASDLSVSQCMALIDNKEGSIENAGLFINGQPLPMHYMVSNYNVVQNENHQLCNKKTNIALMTFDNMGIINKEGAQQNKPVAELQKELNEINSQMVYIQNQVLKTYHSGSRGRSGGYSSQGYEMLKMVDILESKAVKIKSIIANKNN